MSNIIPFDATPAGKAEVPAHIANVFTDSNIAGRASIDQLSFKGKTWTRVVSGEATPLMKTDENGDQVPVPVVSLVVLDMGKQRSRAYYEGGYEDGKNAKPACYSRDGVKPDESVKEPQCTTCAACPQAVKGSKLTDNGKQVTACGQFKRIVVIPSAAAVIKDHPPMLLRIAQTSMWDKENAENEAKGWYAFDQYLDMLRARGVNHTAAVETRVKFDARTAYPKLLFSASRWLSPEETAVIKTRLDTETDAITKIINGGDNDGMMGRHVFEHLTVEENLLAGAYTRRAGRADVRADLERVYAFFPRLKQRRPPRLWPRRPRSPRLRRSRPRQPQSPRSRP